MNLQELQTQQAPNWCPGCGNYGILSALKQAVLELKFNPHQVVLVSGIGCSSKLPHWIKVFGLHTLHGRGLPVAQGIKLAKPCLKVIALGGDGDGYGIGACHFIHALRRNIDLLYLVHNNGVYGLTKGQISPTGPEGFISPTTPYGAVIKPFNPILTALGAGGTFVARAFADQTEDLKNLIIQGINHKGFAFIDILQPCVAFNKLITREWYQRKIYKLKSTPQTLAQAVKLAQETKKTPLGIFWQKEGKSFNEKIKQRDQKIFTQKEIY